MITTMKLVKTNKQTNNKQQTNKQTTEEPWNRANKRLSLNQFHYEKVEPWPHSMTSGHVWYLWTSFD